MEAFEEIVKDRSPKIYYFLRRMGLTHEDADEIVEDVFILFWRDLKSGYGLDTLNFRLYHLAVKKVPDFLKDSKATDRLVVILKHDGGFGFGDISEMTGMDVGEVRDRYKSGLKLKG